MNINNKLQLLCLSLLLLISSCGYPKLEKHVLSCSSPSKVLNVIDVKVSYRCEAFALESFVRMVIKYSNNSNVPVAASINGASTRLEPGQSNDTNVELGENVPNANYKLELEIRTLPR